MNTYEFVKNTFLELTKQTHPYGMEDEYVLEMTGKGIFPHFEMDVVGNYFLKIGDSKTVFASHLDTANSTPSDVVHIIDENGYVKTDGKTILGADDRAGITIMLWMIKHNIPGLYYFFVGEEVGCIGSGNAAVSVKEFVNYDRIISFDRKGTSSVITHQSSMRTCSDDFGNALINEFAKSELTYILDDTGSYTDSAEFTSIISECTNISVGYYAQHTFSEKQDLLHLCALANACLTVEWETLPTVRKPGERDSKWSNNNYTSDTGRTITNWSNYYWNTTTNGWEVINMPKDNQSSKRNKGRGNRGKRGRGRGNYKHPRVIDERRSNRIFIDSIDGLVEVGSNNSHTDSRFEIYGTMVDKFLRSDLNSQEKRAVKNQYELSKRDKDFLI